MLIIGHRGASEAHPANTLAAFAGAAAMGADGIELDLRRAADGTAVVCHDPTLPDGRAIAGLHRTELPGDVPVLDDVLDDERLASLSVLNLEIKNWPRDPDFDPDVGLAAAVVDAVRARPGLGARVLVSAFHLATIDRVRELDPGLATGWLLSARPELAPLVRRAAERGHRAVHPADAAVDADLVRLAHDLDLAVHVWTVDDPDRIRRLAALGVDSVITDVPDVARQALGAPSPFG